MPLWNLRHLEIDVVNAADSIQTATLDSKSFACEIDRFKVGMLITTIFLCSQHDAPPHQTAELPPMDGPAVRSEPQKILAPTTTLPDLRKTPHSGGPLPPPFPPPDNASFTQMSPQNKDSLLQAQASLGAWLEGRVHTLQECVHTLQRELCTSDEERRRLLALNAELLRDAQVRDQLCKVQGRELWRLRQILTGLLPNLSLDPPSGIVKEVRHASEETRREGHGSVRGMLESAERRAQRASGNVPQKGPESRANDRSQEREHVTFDEPFKLSPVPLERHPLAEVEKSSELRAPERGRVGEGGRECKGDAIERSGKLSKCSEEGKPEQPGKEAGFVDRGGLRRGAVVDAEKGGKFCEPCCSKERQAELSLPQQKLSAAGVGKGDADPDASEPSLCPAGEPNPPKIVSSTLARDQSNPVKSTEAPSAPVVELQENGGMISPGGLFDPVGNGNADLMLAGRLAPCSGRRSSGIAPDMVVAMMQLAGRGQAVLSPLGKGGVIQATKGRDGKKEGEKEGSGCGVSESRGGEGGTADGDKRSWGVEGERGRRQKERQRKESEPGVREEVGEGEKYSQGETKSSEGRTSGGEKHYSGGEQENSDWVHEASNGEPGRRGELDGIKNRSNGATEDSVGGPAKEALSAAPGVASLQGGADDAGRQAKVKFQNVFEGESSFLNIQKACRRSDNQGPVFDQAMVCSYRKSCNHRV